MDAFTGREAGYEGALTHTLLAEARAAEGDAAAAREHLVTACRVFAAANAPKRVAAARDLATRLGVEAPAPRSRRGGDAPRRLQPVPSSADAWYPVSSVDIAGTQRAEV